MRRLDDHRFVQLPRPVFDRCKKFGEDMVRHYKAGGSPRSLAVSGGRGAEFNLPRQTQGKLGVPP